MDEDKSTSEPNKSNLMYLSPKIKYSNESQVTVRKLPDHLAYLGPVMPITGGSRPSLPPGAREIGPEGIFKGRILPMFVANPFVPLGLAVTIGALGYGVYNMVTNNQRMQHKMMQLRIAGQFFTIVAIMGGHYYYTHRKQTNLAQDQKLET